jgi:hypothetical protein
VQAGICNRFLPKSDSLRISVREFQILINEKRSAQTGLAPDQSVAGTLTLALPKSARNPKRRCKRSRSTTMDGDRKYRQHGYMDSDRAQSGAFRSDHSERPRPQGPKLPLDVTGPKLPRLVQNVVASRCFNCATTLPEGADWLGNCPKCGAALHCCKQCSQFEPSTRFQCLKPIPARIPVKDQANQCEWFSPRVTVARDALPPPPLAAKASNGKPDLAPRNATDARAAFDNLFKK